MQIANSVDCMEHGNGTFQIQEKSAENNPESIDKCHKPDRMITDSAICPCYPAFGQDKKAGR